MSTVSEHTDTETEEHAEAGEHHEHFSDRQYVYVALFLGFLTAIEVSTYYVDFGPLFIPTLFILMVIKFVVVVSFFMHLKFDNKIFTWMFYTGVFLAIFVYVAALLTFHAFMK